VKFSAGLVYGDATEHSDMQLMLKEADRLLYTVKDSGKDDLKTVRFTASNKA
jgi:PleD family two-component response regulator